MMITKLKGLLSLVLIALQCESDQTSFDSCCDDDDINKIVVSLENLFRQMGILSDSDLTEELLNAVEKLSPESDNLQAILAFQKLQRTVKLSAPVASHGISNFYKRIDEDAKNFQKSMVCLNELKSDVAEKSKVEKKYEIENFEQIVLKFSQTEISSNLIDQDLDDLENGLNLIQDQLKHMLDDDLNEKLAFQEVFFHKEVLNHTIPMIDHLKRLVEASIDLQSLADNDDRDDSEKPWRHTFSRNNVEVPVPVNVHNSRSNFSQGLVSAALRVVAVIGEWRRCIENGLHGSVSKEYMIVCVKHIRETLKHLESACKVQNDEQYIFQSRPYLKFELAADSIKSLISVILGTIQKSTHFGEVKLKSGCKKRGGLRRNRFSIRRVIDTKPKEKEDIHEKIRRLHEQEYKTTGECLLKLRMRDYDRLADAVAIRQSLKEGLRESTLEILKLKESSMQVGIVLEKARIREEELVGMIREEEDEDETGAMKTVF